MVEQVNEPRSYKILTVDDSLSNLRLVESILKRDERLHVTSISVPQEAIQLFRQQSFDLVLLDLSMPQIDGFEVMKRMQAALEPDNFVPIIVLTAHTDEISRLRALSGGATDFLTKPVDPSEVLHRIHNCLELRRLNSLLRGKKQALEQEVEERTRDLRQARDRAEAASRAKTQFLANMSHELRTPLNAIVGFSEVIRDCLFGEQALDRYRSYAGDIAWSAQHLLSLISSILDMTRLESGNWHLEKEKIDAGAVVRSVCNMLREEVDRASLNLVAELPDEPVLLLADERAVRQMLLNLIANAIKFTRSDGTITVTLGADSPEVVTLAVSDTGIGIPTDKLEFILEPFTQADDSLERSFQGAGLGLSITKSLIDLHQGNMRIDSVVNQGTTVTLTIPYDPPEDASATSDSPLIAAGQ